jgi:hypothetical protein
MYISLTWKMLTFPRKFMNACPEPSIIIKIPLMWAANMQSNMPFPEYNMAASLYVTQHKRRNTKPSTDDTFHPTHTQTH